MRIVSGADERCWVINSPVLKGVRKAYQFACVYLDIPGLTLSHKDKLFHLKQLLLGTLMTEEQVDRECVLCVRY